MTDDLDTKTDAEISEIFAVEVAGWKEQWLIITGGYFWRPDGRGHTSYVNEAGRYSREYAESCVNQCDHRPTVIKKDEHQPFATDANAVLPWLGKYMWSACNHNQYPVEVIIGFKDYIAGASTFARAAATALIRARRAEEGAGKS